jgi:hypothetical protein
MEYPALFERAEGGGFVITFPDFEWGSPRATMRRRPGKWRLTLFRR